ncbi:hypothetical protein HO173_012902 [Letharia columbiana]|uniref:Uncharacterized protein n=1 Tax=Letharia columbiana TaxID=112416 RepID=A0A8H6FE18_9LECA|nr:uncharacterized protein HO173_012902 [Letharia columbiana]KAF6224661.1 hypothetical protein HO173_012902 [Letharia columbiana]
MPPSVRIHFDSFKFGQALDLGSPRIENVLCLVLLVSVANAAIMPRQSSSSGRFQFDPNEFLDCRLLCVADIAFTPTSYPMPFKEYWCSHIWADPEVKAVVTQGLQPETLQLYGLNASAKSFCLSLESADYSSFYSSISDALYTKTRPVYFQVTNAQYYVADWTPQVTSPSCDTSCEVRPAITTIVDSDGFTYTSASAYVTYCNISATEDCLGNLGKTIASTMIAHAPTDLKTRDGNYSHSNALVPINYADNYSNCSSNWYSGNSSRILLDAQYDLQHCHPWLQAPPRLEALDPAWANCFRSLDINDPPRALTAADFVAPTPLKHSVSLSVAAPSPGPQAAQPTPSPTPPPSTPAPGGAADSKSASGIPDHPTPAKDPVSADPIAETDAPVATLKHFIDPAPAQNSGPSDTSFNEESGVAAFKPSNDPATVDNSATTDAGVVAPNPTDGPASTKDPGTSDPNVDYGPAIRGYQSYFYFF